MSFSRTYAQTAFVGLGGNSVKPSVLEKSVRANGTIVTPLERLRCGDPGGATTPETENPTGRTWVFVFSGAGPLSAPEIAALDAIVASHDGVEPGIIAAPATSIIEGGGATLTIAAIADGEFVKRSGTTLVGASAGVGGSSLPRYFKRETDGQSITSGTMTNITGLSGISLEIGYAYRIEFCIMHKVSATSAGGLSIKFDGDISNLSIVSSESMGSVSTATFTDIAYAMSGSSATSTSAVYAIYGFGTFSSNSATTLNIQGRKSNTANITLVADKSYVIVDRMPASGTWV